MFSGNNKPNPKDLFEQIFGVEFIAMHPEEENQQSDQPISTEDQPNTIQEEVMQKTFKEVRLNAVESKHIEVVSKTQELLTEAIERRDSKTLYELGAFYLNSLALLISVEKQK
jgi:hypothetical protein